MIDDEKVQIKNKHIDLVKAIRKMRKLLNTEISIIHIYGHQDKKTPYHMLTREAQLNVQVDKQAQDALDEAFENQRFVKQPVFVQEGFQLWLEEEKIHCDFRKELRTYMEKKI